MNEAVTPDWGRVARSMVREAARATLCTLDCQTDGWPYGSLVVLATAADGAPLLLVSDLVPCPRNS